MIAMLGTTKKRMPVPIPQLIMATAYGVSRRGVALRVY